MFCLLSKHKLNKILENNDILPINKLYIIYFFRF